METQLILKDGLARMTCCLCLLLALPGNASAAENQETVQLSYVEAETILPVIEALTEASAPDGGTEKVDLHAVARSNSIVLDGSDNQRALVKRLIARFDQRPKQIYVSAVIAQVELDQDTPDAWHALRQVAEIEMGGGGNAVVLEKYRRPGFGGSVLNIASAESGEDQRDTFLDTYIDALERLENFSVVGRPFVLTGSNQTASIASGQEVSVPGGESGGTVTYQEELMSFEVTPVMHPNKEITLGIDLKFDFDPRSNAMAQRLKTTLRVAERDLVVLSTGAAESKGERRYEHLVFLQPRLFDGTQTLGKRPAEALHEVNNHPAPKAKPIVPRPAQVEIDFEVGDKFLIRELKYLPVSDVIPIVARAIARLSGAEFESDVIADDQAIDPAMIQVGETWIFSDPNLNTLTVGPTEHLQSVDRLLDEIDLRPRQVSIDMSIVEITLSEELKFGMDVLKDGSFGRVGIGGAIADAAGPLTRIESPDPGEKSEVIRVSRLTTTGGGAIMDLEGPSGEAVEGAVGLYVSALAAASDDFQVIAAPQLIATNNRESITSPNEELKIRLNTLIHPDGEVTLEIQTKCEFTTGDDDSKSIQSLNTKVRLQDGSTIVLGGIIRKGRNGGKRKELLIFVEPRIISD